VEHADDTISVTVTRSIEKRFWKKVTKTDSCWLWTGCKSDKGYGRFIVKGKCLRAHRFAYELLVGPIPEGLQLDHVTAAGCVNRCCVNPDHLEPVTSRENSLRSKNTLASINAAKTACKWGHSLAGENVYRRRDGSRECQTCRSAARVRYAQKQATLARFPEVEAVAA
jgi:hypothetical protein